MALKVTIAPTELPLTLDQVKAHLRVTSSTEDADILSYLRAAVDLLDAPSGLLNRAIITQTLSMTLDGFPRLRFALPCPPMVSVSSVAYIDTDGNTQTLATSVYRVLNAAAPNTRGRVELEIDQAWPTTQAVSQSVTVTWVAGYGARNAVPHRVRLLLLSMIKTMYDDRAPMTDKTMTFTPAFKGLLNLSSFPAVG